MARILPALICAAAVSVGFVQWCGAESPAGKVSSADRAFFENRIRPLLSQHCLSCHSAHAKELGGKLLLDTKDGVLQGGESGPAVVPGEPDNSLLIQAVRYDGLEMPPDRPLPPAAVAVLEDWVRRGAPDPREGTAESETTENTASLWSLAPLTAPPVPATSDPQWSLDPIDRFVLAKLQRVGLAPTEDATPRALVRRLYYDLIGLPPTLSEVEAFEAGCRIDRRRATEQLVDELLARPQFGERWGRHWLDVARYAESNGNDGLGRNPTFPHAWRYRDYVIAALNDDVPYDRFVQEQLAGDLLPADSPEQRDRQLVATGFLALASKPAKAMNNNFPMDVVADQIDVVGRGLMGISIACARCHDHKFDPVPTKDYYALAGIFTSSETMWGVAGHEGLTAPPTDLHVLTTPAKVPPPDNFIETVVLLESNTGKPKAIPKSKWAVGTPLAMGVRDRDKVADCKLNLKGDAQKLGEAVPRGFLSVIAGPDTAAIEPSQSGRLQLAQWVTDPRHPLTARVMANRVWLHLFGEGIVRTPDDFGVYGEAPTHPELLDHLASRFIQEGWSVKRLIRAVALSRVYQLSSAAPEWAASDEENRLLGRHSRRRLDAEALRDSMLQVSGQLDLRPGDGSIIRHRDILVNLAGNLHQPSRHRSVYLCYLRSSPPPELAAFDLPDFVAVLGRRAVTTNPAQALHLFNNPFVVEQARALANAAARDSADNNPAEIARHLFRRVLLRDPSADEVANTLKLLAEAEAAEGNGAANGPGGRWAVVCQALLITNEFRYID